MSFRREKYISKGGPDGGDGGDGASIILEAREGVNSLADFVGRQFFRAPNGVQGMGSGCHGRNGIDMVLYVPPGTTIIDPDGGYTIRDLVHPGDSVVLARGGKGGRGNIRFKTSTNRAPRERTRGAIGEIRQIILELKSIADVGLIGKPNAGKSTLLSRLSRARPEIADYPFTTKYPNLGQVHMSSERSFILADIPGLIEGASEGVGLGHEFLKHVERAGILIHLVEPMPSDGTDPLENYRSIRHELDVYSPDLMHRPEVVAITKCELTEADELHRELSAVVGGTVHRISAVTGQGMSELLNDVWDRLVLVRAEATEKSHQELDLSLVATAQAAQPAAEIQAKKPTRLPPHLAGPTAGLSEANPPSKFGSTGEVGSTGDTVQ